MAFSDKEFPYNIYVTFVNGDVVRVTDGKVGKPRVMMEDEDAWKEFYHSNCPGLYKDIKARIEGDEFNPRTSYEKKLEMSEGKLYYVFFRYQDGVCSLWNNGEKMSYLTAVIISDNERELADDDLVDVYPREVGELTDEIITAGIENRDLRG